MKALASRISPRSRAHSPPSSAKGAGFVIAHKSQLWLDGKPFRFASLNAPELLDGDVNGAFEVKDTMATFASSSGDGFGPCTVTRTYTLRITSARVGRGHVNGWSEKQGNWEWDEGRMREFDLVLDEARKRGVKLIIPLINNDCGSETTNWVGDTSDLIKMRKRLGSYEESKQVDWWTDREMIESFKILISTLLTRVNTINSVPYGQDSTVLAWETGNELNERGRCPAPGAWTVELARHLKSLAPNTLVMDGSFARNELVASCWSNEALHCPDVDIISYHYYGNGDISRVKQDIKYAALLGKVFIAGEYGFFSDVGNYARFLEVVDRAGGAGSLAWSFRPHDARGGFKTHGEGNGIWSYHVPGWSDSMDPAFDERAEGIIASIRKASFKILRLPVPQYPVPTPPARLWIDAGRLCWMGSAWAKRYELVVQDLETGAESQRDVLDCVRGVASGVELDVKDKGRVTFRLRSVAVDGRVGEDSAEIGF